MFVRTRTYGPNYSGKQPKAAQTDLKPTQTHPKSASTMPQDMHKLSARTRYQPRIGPVRPKPTQTNSNQPKRHHLRMHSGSKRADKHSIGRQLQQRGGSRQFTAAHTATHTAAHTTRRPMQWLKRRSPWPIRHDVSRGVSRGSPYGTAPQRPTRHSYPHGTATQRLTMVQGDFTARPTR